jgi:peptidoglycan-associated lipoprotein
LVAQLAINFSNMTFMHRFVSQEIPMTSSQRPRLRSVHTAVLLAIALAVTAGCGKKKNVVDPASLGPVASPTAPAAEAPSATLVADPLAIDIGQSVVLNWRTHNATTVTIDGIGTVNPNGTQTVSPSNSTNFHLTAKGDGGTVEANVRVTVRVPEAPLLPTADSSKSNMGTDAEFKANVEDVFFDYDSFDLRPDAAAATVKAASYLVARPDIRIVIYGYCDERGSAEYNLALGENRANAAKTALTAAGVSPARIRVVSYGKEKQFCTAEDEACWQQNRRAQFALDR